MSSISVKSISKSYGATTVIDNLSIDIAEGEFLTLLGPSGCGKTTTLRSIAGLETPDSGQIAIGDDLVTCMFTGLVVPPNRRRLGMVFQSYAIWPHLTVFDNVAYPLRRQKLSGQVIESRVMATLASVGLDHAAHRSATLLSGGQQQRVALARAIVSNPEVLLFDEPLSNLDAQLRIEMRDEIQRIRALGNTTSVYVTHDQSEAFSLSDRVAIMLGGKIVQLDTPTEVVSNPVSLEISRFLGVENIIAATVHSVDSTHMVLEVPAFAGLKLIAPMTRQAAHVGDGMNIAIRATSLEIVGESQALDTNVIHGTIVQTTFLGDAVQYRVAVGGSHVLVRAGAADASPLPAGHSISVQLPVHRLSVFRS
jgi:ABC-type Fe3+/spermidine/putrescine transport system ATPase subunit